MFQGFPEESTEFLWGVRLNNYRDWFLPRKQIYIDSLYEPLKALGAELEQRMAEEWPEEGLQVKVTRIYRDMRGRKYGGPYKDHLWLILRYPREDWAFAPAFYFEISPEGYEYGMGFWSMRPSGLELYRRRLQRDPKSFETLVRRFNRQDRIMLRGEEYKRSKGECSRLLAPWFNRKGIDLCVFHESDERLRSHDLVEDILEDFRFLMPFYRWFRELELEPPLD
ncbi:MAG: DUF2461 domain-containing protein [Oscillospiraceae bacterium]|nr:DUF2461 domain-containing protein [Oscillospiraceae bacterium]